MKYVRIVLVILFCVCSTKSIFAKEELYQNQIFQMITDKKSICVEENKLTLTNAYEKKEQMFIFKPIDAYKVQIVSISSGKVFTVEKGKVVLEENQERESQKWVITQDEKERVLFYNEGYLSIEDTKIVLTKEYKKCTRFELRVVREILPEEEFDTSITTLHVDKESDKKGKFHIEIQDVESNAYVSGVYLDVYPSNHRDQKDTFFLSLNEEGKYETELSSKNFNYQYGNYTVKVRLLLDGIEEEKIGTFTCKVHNIYDSLKEEVEAYINKKKGKKEDWQVYLKDLNHNQEFNINSHKSQSASLMKLFVMGTVYNEYDLICKKYSKEVINQNLQAMINVSDNDAWVNLYTYLGNGNLEKGFKKVSKWANENGYVDVETKPIEAHNYTSTKDCTQFIEDLYREKYKHSKDMIKLLLQQKITHKIPAGLPKGVKVGNKTGELEETENDCAIVYGKSADYALCIMSDHVLDPIKAQKSIVGISKLIYTYLSE